MGEGAILRGEKLINSIRRVSEKKRKRAAPNFGETN